jgi:hypothetical protein
LSKTVFAIGLHLARRQRRQVAPAHRQRALGRHFLAQQQPEQRGFAGAARPGEEHELTLVDRERQAVEGSDVRAVDLRDVVEFDHGQWRGDATLAPPPRS